MDDHFYLAVDSDQKGPYTFSQVQSMWRSGAITADTLYSQKGFEQWVPISGLADLLDAPVSPRAHSQPPSLPAAAAIPEAESDKRILPALILCLLLGGVAAHAFYAGRTRYAVFYLLSLVILFAYGNQLLRLFHLWSLAQVISGQTMAIILATVFVVGDFIRILIGAFKDGKGRRITKWT